jgi:hypothetical protein
MNPNPTNTQRPNYKSEEVLKPAALNLATKVMLWPPVLEEKEKHSLEDLADDLEAAIKDSDDGYDIAKKLDEMGWSPDADLVEILEETACCKRHAWLDACRTWVQEKKLKPLTPGLRVVWEGRGEYGSGVVVTSSLTGHSKVEFTNKDTKVVRIFVVAWEELIRDPAAGQQ